MLDPFHSGGIVPVADPVLRNAMDEDIFDLAKNAMGRSSELPPLEAYQGREPLRIGALVREYEIERLLGQGGFGVTYLCHHRILEGKRVVKELLPEGFIRTGEATVGPDRSIGDNGQDFLELSKGLFMKEARALQRLQGNPDLRHRNIVNVTECFEENRTCYLVMDYEEGVDYETALAASHQAPGREELLCLFDQLCDAVERVHAVDILHLDIKPHNMLIRALDGSPVLLDFGAARSGVGIELATRTVSRSTSAMMYTPKYCALEQVAEGGKKGSWTDVYAIGATAYRAITGHPPPDAIRERAVEAGRGKDPLRPLAGTGYEDLYGSDICRAVDEALVLFPENRTQRVADLRAGLLGEASSFKRNALPGVAKGRGGDTTGRHSGVRVWMSARSWLLLAGGLLLGYVALLIGGRLWTKPVAAEGPTGINETGRMADVPPPSGVSATEATTDDPFVNSLGMRFVPVPVSGGSASAGPILFSAWETRLGDYAEFAEGNTDVFMGWKNITTIPWEQTADHPVVAVPWVDARAFCDWLTKREQVAGWIGPLDRYRLPTDHEWSCAVGIGDEEDPAKLPKVKDGVIPGYPWGPNWPPGVEDGNYDNRQTRAKDGFQYAAPVGSFPPNQFGLHDLGGNIWEWCEDQYGEDGVENRVLRGAAFYASTDYNTLSSTRHDEEPYMQFYSIGFRIVLEIGEED